jgi:hypothetical protein
MALTSRRVARPAKASGCGKTANLLLIVCRLGKRGQCFSIDSGLAAIACSWHLPTGRTLMGQLVPSCSTARVFYCYERALSGQPTPNPSSSLMGLRAFELFVDADPRLAHCQLAHQLPWSHQAKPSFYHCSAPSISRWSNR